MIYYVDGNFSSRKGIDLGSITLHPTGLPHGPQPGLAEKSLGMTETHEYGVMCDTFNPLRLTALASDRDDGADMCSWAVENVEVSPGFHELVERYQPIIVSSGLPQLILPVLEREGVKVEVRSNNAEVRPDGWRVIFRDEGVCPVCGDRCKRRSLPETRPLVFVGDGWSDRCASLAADRVFARTGLAEYLDEQGVPFE